MIQIKILYFFQAVEKNQQIMDLRHQVCHLQEIASIKVRHAIENSDVDLRCIINAMKLRDMKNISDLGIFIEESQNKNVSNLIEVK